MIEKNLGCTFDLVTLLSQLRYRCMMRRSSDRIDQAHVIFFGPKNLLFCLIELYNFTVENVIIFKNIFSKYVSDRTLDPSTEPEATKMYSMQLAYTHTYRSHIACQIKCAHSLHYCIDKRVSTAARPSAYYCAVKYQFQL